MIDGIIDAVCRLGEEFPVIMEGEGPRDSRFDGSRGEGHGVGRKGFRERRTCMIMDLQTLVAEGAVQQLTRPHPIGGGIHEVIHVLCGYQHHCEYARYRFVVGEMEALLRGIFFSLLLFLFEVSTF